MNKTTTYRISFRGNNIKFPWKLFPFKKYRPEIRVNNFRIVNWGYGYAL